MIYKYKPPKMTQEIFLIQVLMEVGGKESQVGMEAI